MALNVGRKGFFFTISSLLFVMVAVGYLLLSQTAQKDDGALVEQDRVLMLDELLRGIQRDFQKALYISGYRAMTVMVQEAISTGQSESMAHFQELVTNGSMDGQPSSLMQNMTLKVWVNRTQEKLSQFHAQSTIGITDIATSQKDPWAVTVSATLALSLHDDTASFNTTKMLSSSISIIGFEDPQFAINSQGMLTRVIQKSNATAFVNGTSAAPLLDHLEQGLYINATAPSFLGRLFGNLTPVQNGIESLVSEPDFMAVGMPPKNVTAVDYLYFQGSGMNKTRIQGMPDWFWLDENATYRYGVANLTR